MEASFCGPNKASIKGDEPNELYHYNSEDFEDFGKALLKSILIYSDDFQNIKEELKQKLTEVV